MSTTIDKLSGDLHKRPELRKAFSLLKTHASKVANFTLQWQDLEEHFLSIDHSIQSKIDQLQQKPQSEVTLVTPTIQSQPSSKETQLNSELNSKETQFNSKETEFTATLQSLKTQVKKEESLPESSNCNGVPIHDGKALLLYLNEHLKERESMRDLIANVLKASVDSGKLVLEAIRWFYPPESYKEDMDFELTVVRRSCVLLLEELMKVRPLIRPEISKEAKKLALDWKAKVKDETTNFLEVWGFLQLLGAFGLVGEFDSDEVLKFVGCVADRKQAPELFRSLGFANKASDFIEKLVSEDKRLDAIRFIHAFQQLEKFPPVPLLRAHLKFAEKDVRMSCKRGQDPLKAQDETTDKEIVSLRGIIRCIENYKLDVGPQHSPENLRKRINQLKKQRKERKATLTAPGPAAQVQNIIGKKRTASDFKAQQNKQSRNKQCRTAPSSAAQNVSFRAPATVHSIQPSYLRPVDLFESQGADYFQPSDGMCGQAATAHNTSYGTNFHFNSLRASHHQQAGSFTGQGAEYSAGYYDSAHSIPDTHNSLAAGRYGFLGSSPVIHTLNMSLTGAGAYGLTGSSLVTQHMNSTIASYGLGSSTSATSHMSPLTRRYWTSMVANGRTDSPPIPNSSIPYVSGDPLRMPNNNDRPVSSSSGFSMLSQSQCTPSIYRI